MGYIMSNLGSTLESFSKNYNPKISNVNSQANNINYSFVSSNNVTSKVESMDFDDVVSNNLESFKNTVTNMGSVVVSEAKSLIASSKQLLGTAKDWLVNDAVPAINAANDKVNNVFERTGATFATVEVSLVEGVAKLGEALIDTDAIIYSAIKSVPTLILDCYGTVFSKITGKEFESQTAKLWESTKSFVAKKYVANWFDSFYANSSVGQWLKTKAFLFDDVRSASSNVSYAFGIIGLSLLTGGSTFAVAGALGVGKGAEEAWGNDASVISGLTTGALTGVWEGFQYYIGSKINGLILFKGSEITTKTKLINSLVHVVLDGIDGGAEGFVKPLIDTIYKDGYTDENGNYIEYTDADNFLKRLQENFDDNGGFNTVITGAISGSVTSALSEVLDLGKYFKESSAANNIKKLIEQVETGKINNSEFKDIVSKMNSNQLETFLMTCKDSSMVNDIFNFATVGSLCDACLNMKNNNDLLKDIFLKLDDKTLSDFLSTNLKDSTSLDLSQVIQRNRLYSLINENLLPNLRSSIDVSLDGVTKTSISTVDLLKLISENDDFSNLASDGGIFTDGAINDLFVKGSKKEYLAAVSKLETIIKDGGYQEFFSEDELKHIDLLKSNLNFDTLISVEKALGENITLPDGNSIASDKLLNMVLLFGVSAVDSNKKILKGYSNSELIPVIKDMFTKIDNLENRGYKIDFDLQNKNYILENLDKLNSKETLTNFLNSEFVESLKSIIGDGFDFETLKNKITYLYKKEYDLLDHDPDAPAFCSNGKIYVDVDSSSIADLKNITYHESLHFFSATPVIEYKGLAAKKNGLELDLESGNGAIVRVNTGFNEALTQLMANKVSGIKELADCTYNKGIECLERLITLGIPDVNFDNLKEMYFNQSTDSIYKFVSIFNKLGGPNGFVDFSSAFDEATLGNNSDNLNKIINQYISSIRKAS